MGVTKRSGLLVAGLLVAGCTATPVTEGQPTSTVVEIASTTIPSIPQVTSTTAASQPGGPALEGAPAAVANREPLFYCGAEVVEGFTSSNPYDYIEVVDGASDCYHERATAGQPAELILVMVTVEGDPIMQIRRFMPGGNEIYFWDYTQDSFGSSDWVMFDCDGYTGRDETEGDCGTGVVLDR